MRKLKKHAQITVMDRGMITTSIKDAFCMLTPRVQIKNPVMFVTYLGAIITTICVVQDVMNKYSLLFDLQIALWLWFTVLFANFSQAIAESRGKAQAAALRKTKTDTLTKVVSDGKTKSVLASQLKCGDIVLCESSEIIPADGDVIEGAAMVDESAITGESAPVIRESGGDRSAVTAGTKVLSDRLLIKVTSDVGNSFLDRMINLIEGAKRQKTPNEIALNIVLFALMLIFFLTTSSLKAFADYSEVIAGQELVSRISLPILVALFVCLIPTTISALLSAVGIAGMNRLVCKNVIAKSGRSVEAAGDVDLLILDKTGTITIGSRMALQFMPLPGVSELECAKYAQAASLADETPEGRSIVVLAKNQFGLRDWDQEGVLSHKKSIFIPFSAKTCMSGVDFLDEKGLVVRRIRKGSVHAIKKYVEDLGGTYSKQIDSMVEAVASHGGTPLLVSDEHKIIGVVHLKDMVKGGIKERFIAMRKMGIRTVMVTGDNPLTAAAIAAEAGVDDFIAEATPEIKLDLIKKEQEGGRLVAMTGDGTNDAPALAQADVAVAMNTGTQASRDAGNMVDLDSNPTKLLDIVEIGKQLLMTRGALTTFSIANDVAKYFAIIPAIFGTLYIVKENQGPLSALNIMFLHTYQSAILSALIFNALIIIILIPLALRGVKYKAQPANVILRKNILIYGLGGIIAPFIGIKLIDLIITFLGIVV
ncbi:MAG: potassium-transporting ATPase subunit KdpB [Chlamydiales bacterium]|nr:potassium-transporting ATPase subunit KdpB [Chlamydiales bacterium]